HIEHRWAPAGRRATRVIRPYRAIEHGPTTSMYYADPDGNRVELQVDNFESPEEATAWMSSPALAANPSGVDFDPEDYAVLSGADASALSRKRPMRSHAS